MRQGCAWPLPCYPRRPLPSHTRNPACRLPILPAVLYMDMDIALLKDPLAYLAAQPSASYDVQASVFPLFSACLRRACMLCSQGLGA